MGAAEPTPVGDDLDLFEHEGVLRATAMHLCRREWETDDLVQDTFERALKFLAAGNPRPAHIRAWLVSILRNAFIDRVRRRAVTFESLDAASDSQQPAAPEREPEPVWARVSLAQVREAIGHLDADQRRVFELHYLDGLLYRDIAERMAIPQNTVASRLFRARKALHKLLAPTLEAER